MSSQTGLLRLLRRAIRERPLYLLEYARGYLLFRRTAALRAMAPGLFGRPAGIFLGKNVRVQRLSCLRAERGGSKISVGDHSIVYENARIEAFGGGEISIGACTVVGDARVACRARIAVGERVVMSWNVFIQDFDPHPIDPAQRAIQIHNLCASFHPSAGGITRRAWATSDASPPAFTSDPITIGDDVWLGANTVILKGAHIGRGSIVSAGAVVTAGDWPPNSILAGSPARVVKTLA
jgi:acetyltransferase-like isoleucine patch superfamily enzyme